MSVPVRVRRDEPTLGLVLSAVLLLAAVGCGEGDPRNILTAGEPSKVISFEMKEPSGEILWRIVSSSAQPLDEIHYGVVPKGFVQEVPAGNACPRPFRDREVLVAVTDLESRVLEHRGKAVGADGFRGGAYHSKNKPLALPSAAQ